MRGPLGVGRVARTRVVATDEPSSLQGVAELGDGTQASVRWNIVPDGEGSRVTLAATVERASVGDRVLLALGGRRWLERLFAAAVARLDHEIGD